MSTTKQVTKEMSDLKVTIGKMSGRISGLVDDIYVLRAEMKKFKSDVAEDITTLENMHKERR